ncbi:tetratricopeptide repeat protein [bacterium]|nr:tetratricopeptide repeat protein [bacterium]MCP5461974.1 tetratricopeptide repeat protein [bacterium]
MPLDTSKFNEAVDIYTKVIQSDSENSQAYCSLGNVLYILERYEDAIEAYSNACRINLHFAEAYYNRGLSYTKLGNFSQAQPDYAQAMLIKPDIAEDDYFRGNSCVLLARYEEPLKEPDKTAEAHTSFGNALLDNECFAEAADMFKQALWIDEHNPRAHFGYALALLHLGNIAIALKHHAILKMLDEKRAEHLASYLP